MNLIFFDGIPWNYDVSTPLNSPLGGSQSALCYLAVELAKRGHQVTVVCGVDVARQVLGVQCIPLSGVHSGLLSQEYDAFIVLNGPVELATQLRPHLSQRTPLILWTQHAHDQAAMQGMSQRPLRDQWDEVVLISDWQKRAFSEIFGSDLSRAVILRNAMSPVFEGLFSSAEMLSAAKQGPTVLAYTSTPFRGLNILAAIYPEVYGEFPDAELRIYSSMKVYQQSEQQDAHRDLYQYCRNLPGTKYIGSLPQRQLAQELSQAAILSYPCTFAETGCISAIEAMAAGAHVVSSELGALPETTLGLADLVPFSAREEEWGVFASAYLKRLKEVLRQRNQDRQGFDQEAYHRVCEINRTSTWKRRAEEWEPHLESWKRRKRGG